MNYESTTSETHYMSRWQQAPKDIQVKYKDSKYFQKCKRKNIARMDLWCKTMSVTIWRINPLKTDIHNLTIHEKIERRELILKIGIDRWKRTFFRNFSIPFQEFHRATLFKLGALSTNELWELRTTKKGDAT